MTATLASNGTLVPNEPVSFALSVGSVSATFGPATTGTNGVATLTVLLPAGIEAGTFNAAVTASFAGDQNYQSASCTGTLVISPATPVVTWSNPTAIVYGTAGLH